MTDAKRQMTWQLHAMFPELHVDSIVAAVLAADGNFDRALGACLDAQRREADAVPQHRIDAAVAAESLRSTTAPTPAAAATAVTVAATSSDAATAAAPPAPAPAPAPSKHELYEAVVKRLTAIYPHHSLDDLWTATIRAKGNLVEASAACARTAPVDEALVGVGSGGGEREAPRDRDEVADYAELPAAFAPLMLGQSVDDGVPSPARDGDDDGDDGDGDDDDDDGDDDAHEDAGAIALGGAADDDDASVDPEELRRFVAARLRQARALEQMHQLSVAQSASNADALIAAALQEEENRAAGNAVGRQMAAFVPRDIGDLEAQRAAARTFERLTPEQQRLLLEHQHQQQRLHMPPPPPAPPSYSVNAKLFACQRCVRSFKCAHALQQHTLAKHAEML